MLNWYGIPGYPPQLAVVKSEQKKIPFLTSLPSQPSDNDGGNNTSLAIYIQFKTHQWPDPESLQEKWKRWGFCYVDPVNNYVYFRFPLGPFRFRLILGDLHSDSPTFSVSPLYWRLFFNIGTALSPYYVHLRDIITMNLLNRGYLTIHGACLCSSRGEASLIMAPPETGKTLTALLGQKEGYGLLSEDLVVSDGVNIIPSLLEGQKIWSPAFLSMQKGIKAKLQRVSTRLVERAGIEAYTGLLAQLGGSTVQNPYDKTATLKNIFFLARSPHSAITPMNRSDALARMRIIARGEFHWRSNPVLLAYDYHTMRLDVPRLLEKEDALLRTVIDKSASCYQLEAPNPYEFIGLIQKVFPL
ncbi:MAG: hypothetical protein PHN78_05580 [Dehalococcoidales bacterium]|nr:hypothetical protein [Dehalococcoidales bacterium]